MVVIEGEEYSPVPARVNLHTVWALQQPVRGGSDRLLICPVLARRYGGGTVR